MAYGAPTSAHSSIPSAFSMAHIRSSSESSISEHKEHLAFLTTATLREKIRQEA